MKSSDHDPSCASYVNGRGCKNDARIRRDVVESGLLTGIKRDLLSPAAIEEVRRRVVKLVNTKNLGIDRDKAIAKAEAEVIAGLTLLMESMRGQSAGRQVRTPDFDSPLL